MSVSLTTTLRRIAMLAMALVVSGILHAQGVGSGQYADVNGIRMYYEVHGAGQSLVLIHGGGSTIETSFGRLMPELAKTHRVIAMELQAHGRTSDRKAPESFEQDADDVARLLEQLGVARADIIGFSNGGSTALQLAMRHPGRVRRIIPIAAIYKRDGMPRGFWSMMEKATLNDMPQPLKDAFLRVNPDREKLVAMFNKDRQRMLAFKDWKDSRLKSIAAPALIVVGDRDVVRAEHAVEMARVLPHARLAILPGVHGEAIGESTTPQNSKVFPLFVALVEEFLAAPAP